MLEWMPYPVEGIYWFGGAVIYTPCFTGLMMLLVLMTEIQRSFGKGRIRKILLLSLAVIAVSFLLGGGNQLCSFSGALGMFVIVAVSIYVKKDKRLAVLDIALFLAMFAFFCLNVLAPGTAIREAAYAQTRQYGVIGTIFFAIVHGTRYCLQWSSPYIVLLLIASLPIAVPLVANFCKKSDFSFAHPALVFVLSIGWVCALYCPGLYGMGVIFPGGRTSDYIYYNFIAVLFFNEIYILGFIYRTKLITAKEVRGAISKIRGGLPRSMRFQIIALFSAAVLCIAIGEAGNWRLTINHSTLRVFAKRTSSTRAIGSLLSGSAKCYSDENYERIKIYQASKGLDVKVKEFSEKPRLLLFNDITDDKSHWINNNVAGYYSLKSVVLLPNGDK